MRSLSTLAVLAGFVAAPQMAYAHAELISSVPAAGGAFASSAKEITLTYDEAVTPVTCKLTGAADKEVAGIGKPKADGATLHVPVTAPLAEGNYNLACRVVGPDSHPINSALSFVVGAAAHDHNH